MSFAETWMVFPIASLGIVRYCSVAVMDHLPNLKKFGHN